MWLVRVTDVTATAQMARELEELRIQVQMQGEILRGVLHMGGARFAAFLQRTEASMKTINSILKKPAREEEAFRHKLEEALDEVDRVRRDAAAFKLSALEGAARLFEDSLHDLRSRKSLSGSEFLPLAVKLDQLYGQFASLKSLTKSAAPVRNAAAHVTSAEHDRKRHSDHTGAKIHARRNRSRNRCPALSARPRREASRAPCVRSPSTSRRSTTRP